MDICGLGTHRYTTSDAPTTSRARPTASRTFLLFICKPPAVWSKPIQMEKRLDFLPTSQGLLLDATAQMGGKSLSRLVGSACRPPCLPVATNGISSVDDMEAASPLLRVV